MKQLIQLFIVKKTDFGISSEFTNENNEIYNPAIIEGTLTYMLPEQSGRMNSSVDMIPY